MASNQDLKKAQRKADELLPPRQCRRGRQQHQKMKPYLVLQYLQANTDENHSVSASEISGYLEEILGINADRRSIYSDIDEINAVAWMLENDTDIDEAYEAIKEENAEKLIVYDRKKGGYNITHTLGILRCFKDVENIFKVVQLLFWHLQFSHKTCPHPCTFSAS